MNSKALEQSVVQMHLMHSPEVLEVASMVHTARRLFGHLRDTTKIDTDPMLKTLDRCVESHLIEHDIHPHELRQALDDFQVFERQANEPSLPLGTPAAPPQ